jgi:hypothetical protein
MVISGVIGINKGAQYTSLLAAGVTAMGMAFFQSEWVNDPPSRLSLFLADRFKAIHGTLCTRRPVA